MKILLKKVLEEKGLTYRQVEKITGISKSSVSELANGRIIPKLDTLELLAKKLDVKITDLFDSPYK